MILNMLCGIENNGSSFSDETTLSSMVDVTPTSATALSASIPSISGYTLVALFVNTKANSTSASSGKCIMSMIASIDGGASATNMAFAVKYGNGVLSYGMLSDSVVSVSASESSSTWSVSVTVDSENYKFDTGTDYHVIGVFSKNT